MCGIAGIWGSVSADRLGAMTDVLRHRGPDDEGAWLADNRAIGLAYRRLAVIDLEGGKQPMTNEDGRVVTVFNGEIYNYRELREELIGRGHQLRTTCDTEVIVHLYEDYGDSFVDHLRGMFAVAVWDEREQTLVLARDRVGKKPLYYRESNDEFLFASEIKSVLAGGKDEPAIDHDALADYFTWTVIPAPATIYRDVRAVSPGELLVVKDRRVMRRHRFWRQRMQPKLTLSNRDALEQIDERLHEAVALRLRSDVPVGCFLSGGIDSGLIVAMAAEQSTHRLTTITIGFDDEAFDERPLAQLVADRYGTDHHEIVVTPTVEADLPAIARAYDQPFGDSSAVPSYYVARAARQHVKVVLNGDGGDELFAGYRRYVAARLSGLLGWSDNAAGRAIWGALAAMMPTPSRFRTGYAFLERFARGMTLTEPSRYLSWSVGGFDEAGLSDLLGAEPTAAWFTNGGGRLATVDRATRILCETYAEAGAAGPVGRMLAGDFAVVLPNDLLVKMDIATMAHGLEARSPFLDQALVEFVSRLPGPLKVSAMRTKPLLRRLAGRYLPPRVCRAPKRGFEVPLVRWLENDLRDLCEDVILTRHGILADIFARPALERLLRRRGSLDPARWSRRVWLLLMLGMWDRHARPTGRGCTHETHGQDMAPTRP